jgi:hypothetical protein
LAHSFPTLAIVRIVGNELAFRHSKGSNLEQLCFILRHEPTPSYVKKIWLLNRIYDREMAQALKDAIQQDGYVAHEIPPDNMLYKERQKQWVRPPISKRFRHEDILYVRHMADALIQINNARNTAVRLGKQEADWVMPLDGGCCFDQSGLDQLFARPVANVHVLATPSVRISTYGEYGTMQIQKAQYSECMLMFDKTVDTPFDESIPYGSGDKVDCIRRMFPHQHIISDNGSTIINSDHLMRGYVYRLPTGPRLVNQSSLIRKYTRYIALNRLIQTCAI